MSLIRWNPTRYAAWPSDVVSMQREINNMFDRFFGDDVATDSAKLTTWAPAVDIAEHDDEYVVKVELPGVAKDEVKITLESNILTISGEKRQDKESKKENVHRMERVYGSFQRSFTLPSTVRSEKIDAFFRDGILNISLPKAEEAKPKQIEVHVR